MDKYEYCIVSIYNNDEITFKAYQPSWGVYCVRNYDDENILWYDSKDEAKEEISNENEFILSRFKKQ